MFSVKSFNSEVISLYDLLDGDHIAMANANFLSKLRDALIEYDIEKEFVLSNGIKPHANVIVYLGEGVGIASEIDESDGDVILNDKPDCWTTDENGVDIWNEKGYSIISSLQQELKEKVNKLVSYLKDKGFKVL